MPCALTVTVAPRACKADSLSKLARSELAQPLTVRVVTRKAAPKRSHHPVPETAAKLLLTWVNGPDPNL